jgi:putative transposase
MSRHTTFRFCPDPTVEQCEVLARHAGASRFAFNQCLRIVKAGLTERKTDPDVTVPCTDQHPTCAGETSPNDAGTDVHTAPAV